ncbi:LytR/AlgR family response regulator transcription factor [Microbulbifer thermotolerans]|uniref:LytR/AlgR family response regulator transcription factor n=1 Tax=Microbulbifer thermotolerans TaxID=252514 RepID=UPI002248C385|nr:LytTR family DNA-binding domain-containing protein [Microbulbifer thermotolerans]MCX2778314.1 LytTR family DNA-binding domain-containing protein [Microbulbifer thermotolerans]MCX2796124.1 LytTR family DNA-binding domain-containing protein [Microbulbifer thermotolerans]MCX2804353.1 LytTR family DNA-binding domain-containing protein [Microbulbifer thermotolerans]MCX2840529.1 LytTR family DNA-binding domain-containing protein [Microbulbifer thermotolerans]
MNGKTDPLRAIVIDDEPLARRGLCLRLDEIGGIEVIAECGNGRQGLEHILELRPDVAFVDIQMPGISGLELVQRIPVEQLPQVVFVTAYDQYAVEAFEVNAVDYVLKPIEEERLALALERVREKIANADIASQREQLLEAVAGLTKEAPEVLEQKLVAGELGGSAYPEKIAIKDSGKITLVPTREIDWIDAAGDYMCVHAKGETHVMRITMKELEQQLDPRVFQRIHRSTIVNLNRVCEICAHINGEYHLVLNNGERLKMSRSYKNKVQHFL